MNSGIIYDSQSLVILNTLYKDFIATNGYVPKANPSNTTTVNATYTATLQGLAGEVEYSSISIPTGDMVNFTINNTYATDSKRVYPYIALGNNGNPFVVSALCGTGNIIIKVSSFVDPEDALVIGFIFLN